MLCENEQADLEGEYVLHTHKPRFLARRTYDKPGYHFVIADMIDEAGDAAVTDRLLREAGQWFASYQRYLDEQYGEDD